MENMRKNMAEGANGAAGIPDITDYGAARPMLSLGLVNRKAIHGEAAARLHIPFLDLEVIFQLEFGGCFQAAGGMAVTEMMRKKWGVEPERLYQDALANMQEKAPAATWVLQKETAHADGTASPDDMSYMLGQEKAVILTGRCAYGAAAVLYPDALEKCAEYIGDDLVIIPLGIHGVLLHPMRAVKDISAIAEIIRWDYENGAPKEEFLSGHPYLYRTEDGRITM